MVRKSYTQEQIINKLREVEILLNQGVNIGEVSRKIRVIKQTYYRWPKEYGGMRIEQVKRLKDTCVGENVVIRQVLHILEGGYDYA